jgi:hypothetical protein
LFVSFIGLPKYNQSNITILLSLVDSPHSKATLSAGVVWISIDEIILDFNF